MDKRILEIDIPANWERKKLNTCIHEMKSGLSRKLSDSNIGIGVIRSNNLVNNSVEFDDLKYWYKKDPQGANITNYILHPGDVLINFINSLAQIGKGGVFPDNGTECIFTTNLMRVKFNEKLNPKYFIYHTQTSSYRKHVYKITNPAVNQASFLPKEFGKYDILLPALHEQNEIVNILSTWDEAIRLLKNLLDEISIEKRAITNRIYRGLINKDHNETTFKRLKKHIKEVSVRNKNSIMNNVLSVSNSKGFIPQDQQFDRVIASKDRTNYKIIRRHQFAYNPSRVNVGSIDLLENYDQGLLSPMYVVFECLKSLDEKYLYHFLKSEYFLKLIPRYTQGSVRDSLSFSGLGSMKIYLPSIEEQKEYSSLLDSIDEEANMVQKVIELYSEQKLGLMQQLLSGKIRVRTS